MKRFTALMLTLVILTTSFGCSVFQKDVVAKVNGENITQKQFDAYYKTFAKMVESTGLVLDTKNEDYKKILQEEALNSLIEEVLLKQEIKKANITMDEKEAKNYVVAMKAAYGEKAFKQSLKGMGMTEEAYIEDYMFGQVVNKLYAKVTRNILLSDEDIKGYYDLNPTDYAKAKASHILIIVDWNKDSKEVQAEKLAKAKNVIERLNNGEDFAKVAKEVSEDTGSKDNGGVLESFFSVTDSPYDDQFTLSALKLNKGEYTKEPVETQFGYHIIKLDEKLTDYDSVKEDVKTALYSKKAEEKIMDYKAQLKEKADIKIYLGKDTEKSNTTKKDSK